MATRGIRKAGNGVFFGVSDGDDVRQVRAGGAERTGYVVSLDDYRKDHVNAPYLSPRRFRSLAGRRIVKNGMISLAGPLDGVSVLREHLLDFADTRRHERFFDGSARHRF
jgi:hypothetical protein